MGLKTIQDQIDYAPEALKSFHVSPYEWIDNLDFTLNPADYLENAELYISAAKEKFLEAEWDGDGEIRLMWIPPFMLKELSTYGLIVWHVKQLENGISWILSPIEIPLFSKYFFETT